MPSSDRSTSTLPDEKVVWPHVHERVRQITSPEKLLKLARGKKFLHQDLEGQARGWIELPPETIARNGQVFNEELLDYLIVEKLDGVYWGLRHNEKLLQLPSRMVGPRLVERMQKTGPDQRSTRVLDFFSVWVQSIPELDTDTQQQLRQLAAQGEVNTPSTKTSPRLVAAQALMGPAYQNHIQPATRQDLQQLMHWSWTFEEGLMRQALQITEDLEFYQSYFQKALDKLEEHQEQENPKKSWRRSDGQALVRPGGIDLALLHPSWPKDRAMRELLIRGADIHDLPKLMARADDQQKQRMLKRLRDEIEDGAERARWLRRSKEGAHDLMEWQELKKLVKAPDQCSPETYMPLLAITRPTDQELREGFEWLAYHGTLEEALDVALAHKEQARQCFAEKQQQLLQKLFRQARPQTPEYRKAFRALQLVDHPPDTEDRQLDPR